MALVSGSTESFHGLKILDMNELDATHVRKS